MRTQSPNTGLRVMVRSRQKAAWGFSVSTFSKRCHCKAAMGRWGGGGDRSQIRVIGKIRLVVPVLRILAHSLCLRSCCCQEGRVLAFTFTFWSRGDLLGVQSWTEPNPSSSHKTSSHSGFAVTRDAGISLALCKLTAIPLDGAKTESQEGWWWWGPESPSVFKIKL